MQHGKYLVSLITVMALVLMFMGCAKPPEAEKSAAKAAQDAAVTAGADKYATADFEAAKKFWDGAEAKMTEKAYKEAKQGYDEAKAAFEKAAGAAEGGKKTVADEVNATVAGLEEAWKNLGEAAQKVEKRMKDQKTIWDADVKAFTDGLQATKDLTAADPAGAKVKAAELKAIIDKWDAAVKELAALPEKPEPKTTKAKKK